MLPVNVSDRAEPALRKSRGIAKHCLRDTGAMCPTMMMKNDTKFALKGEGPKGIEGFYETPQPWLMRL
jgi:hypothetical protein